MDRRIALSALLVVGLLGCGDENDAERRAAEEARVSAEAARDQALEEAEALEERIAELTDQLQSAEVEAAASGAALEETRDTVTWADAERTRIQRELEEATAALARAEALASAEDYDAALAELSEARDALEDAEETLANAPGQVSLDVQFAFGNDSLELGTAYSLGGGASVTFSELRYWLSNVELVRADGERVAIPASYYLMEARGEQTLSNGTQASITLPAARRETVLMKDVPPGRYTGLAFAVGIDPEHNDDLSRADGELHVLKNMTSFQWMWFTSYIFTKLRAEYTSTGNPAAALAWDNGTNSDFRELQVAFRSPLSVGLGTSANVRMKLDAQKLFEDLSPSTTATIGASTGALRATLADNWQGAFSYVSSTTTAQ